MKIAAGLPVLLTGASSGIGHALALELARRGCRLALVARSGDALAELAEACRTAGGEGLALPVDVRDEAGMADAVATAVERFGGLRLVVANAGLGRYAEVIDQPAEHVETTISINYVGLARTVRLTLPHLLAATPAHVVGITSSAGLIPHAHGSAYCASKAASNQYLAALRLEVKDRGVGVTMVCPGVVATPFVDKAGLDTTAHLPRLNRLTVPLLHTDQVVRATIRGIESDRRVVTLPAMLRFYAWTMRIAPGFSDWLMRRTG